MPIPSTTGTPAASRLKRWIDPEEPELVADLLDQANRLNMRASLGSPPTIVLVVVTLWAHAPRSGLMIWATCATATAAMHITLHGLHRRRSSSRSVWFWRRCYTTALVIGGALWGTIPLLMLPGDEHREFQALVALYVISFMAANTIFTSPLRRLFLAFQVPLAAMGSLGLLLNGAGFTSMLAVIVLYALPFSGMLFDQANRAAVDAVRLAHRNSKLVAELRDERHRIEATNIELRDVNERLAHQAEHDALTDLANRPLFRSQLEAALADAGGTTSMVAVLFVDLDRFKMVNDSLGHHVGDDLLIAVADRIRRSLGSDDVLGRQGGDEFTVLLTGVADRSTALGVAESIRSALRDPVVVGAREMLVTASIGCAVNSHPDDTADDLLRHADAAMYRAKAVGRNCVELFDESMRNALARRVDDENDLRRAFADHEIVSWYQPEVDLVTGRIVGAESLARWIHPVDGVRSAAAFVPLVEDSGMLHELWLMNARSGSAAIAALGDVADPDFRIRINVSASQIMDLGLLNGWLAHLERRGLNTSMVSLEVTETAVIQDMAAARAWLHTARRVGMKVSLDDFGTGYSSLALVSQLPLDGVKIDYGFVRDMLTSPAARAVVAATVELADVLGLEVVAEGVETEQQAEALRQMGVRRAQGFLYAPAVPLDTLHDWLVGTPPWLQTIEASATDVGAFAPVAAR